MFCTWTSRIVLFVVLSVLYSGFEVALSMQIWCSYSIIELHIHLRNTKYHRHYICNKLDMSANRVILALILENQDILVLIEKATYCEQFLTEFWLDYMSWSGTPELESQAHSGKIRQWRVADTQTVDRIRHYLQGVFCLKMDIETWYLIWLCSMPFLITLGNWPWFHDFDLGYIVWISSQLLLMPTF